MSNLIEKLTQLQHLTPDEIVSQLSPRWRPCNTLTADEYYRRGGDQIHLYEFDAYGPGDHFNSYPTRYMLSDWRYDAWIDQEILGRYWFIYAETHHGNRSDIPTR